MNEIPTVEPGELLSAEKVNALLGAAKICFNTKAKSPVELVKADAGWVIGGGKEWVSIFYDDFNTENGGAVSGNYDAFLNWEVYLNFVDLANSLTIPGADGLFVDMVGTTGSTVPEGTGFIGGVRTIETWLTRGRYRLSWRMSGSQRGANSDVTVSLGTAFNQVFSLASADPWADYTFTFTVTAATGGKIQFHCRTTNQNPSTIDRGAGIDNVRLERFQ